MNDQSITQSSNHSVFQSINHHSLFLRWLPTILKVIDFCLAFNRRWSEKVPINQDGLLNYSGIKDGRNEPFSVEQVFGEKMRGNCPGMQQVGREERVERGWSFNYEWHSRSSLRTKLSTWMSAPPVDNAITNKQYTKTICHLYIHTHLYAYMHIYIYAYSYLRVYIYRKKRNWQSVMLREDL